jgi:hypothetical protein
MEQGKAPKIDDLFSLAYSTLFEVAKYARNEEHWSITKEEASKLGKVSVSCLNTVPAASKAKVEQKFSKYLPWCALIGFGMVITYPRVALSIALEKDKKSKRFPVVKFPQAEEPKATNEQAVRFAPAPAGAGIKPDNVTSFPPGPKSAFPPLDYEIPS